ncbi:MAG: carboxylating nicotinate-nucleotide diphosphorylase [Alphaproteobacteria bacterium]|nr:carboxylating nicotinate-nucleotide diphosphorylase [Alphaproteobacteria bacterium]
MRPPHDLLVEPVVRRALEEDLGRAGDLTSDLIVPAGQTATARLMARKAGTGAGLNAARLAFGLADPGLVFEEICADGTSFNDNTLLGTVSGSARGLLLAERVALNFLGRLSGIATATRALVNAVAGTRARIVCTRKTTPGLRLLEKYAVRCGGGFNHRLGLDDAVLIKDNHLAICGGVRPAIERARGGLGHMVRIELEVDRLDQLEEALGLGVDTILLDNMSLADLRHAVSLAAGKATLEASGNVTLASVKAIAETGVDYISSGAITHSAAALDVALDF